MSTKYEIIEVNKKEVMVDVSMLIKSDDMFFNATKIAKQYGKQPGDFWKQQQNIEYLEVLIALSQGNKNDFLYSKKGKYGGSWFHKDLALQFARWLDPMFAVLLDKWIIQRLTDEHNRKQKRLEAKTGYLPLTNAIEESHDPAMFYHYSTEADMINRIILGMSAKKYKKMHQIESVRDNCTVLELNQFEELQRYDAILIKSLINYNDRKTLLETYFCKALN